MLPHLLRTISAIIGEGEADMFVFAPAGKTFGSPGSWAQLASGDVALKLAPAFAGAGVLWLVSSTPQEP